MVETTNEVTTILPLRRGAIDMVLTESDDVLERGDAAPDFALPATDGKTYALSDFSSASAVLVVFTCNHCPYAKAKFDLLNELADEYGDDVAVVGINPNDAEEYPEDSFEKMKEYVSDGRIAYDAYLRDESQTVAAAYGATCTPDPFLLSSDGDEFTLVYHGRLDDAHDPETEPTAFPIRVAIDAVLAGESVEVEEIPSRGCSIKWKS